MLERIYTALDESPEPAHERRALRGVLGSELLARLLRISESSVRRYYSGTRSTPDGAWAEFLRHEEIVDPRDLPTIRRAIWAVDIGEEPAARPGLPLATLLGGPATWSACRSEGARLRSSGRTGLTAPSAALRRGGAHGWRVDGGLRTGPDRDGKVFALFGCRPDLVGWPVTFDGRPGEELLVRVRHC